MAKPTAWFRERNLLLAFLSVGGAERIAWAIVRPGVAHSEAASVAISLAQGRGFADAYAAGQGATAHLLPITPLLASGVYRVFGIRSLLSEIILACGSIGLALGSYLLFYRAFGRLGVPQWARLGTLAFLCLAPTYIGQEVIDFRIWEGGLTAFLTAVFLDRVIRQADASRGDWQRIALFAALNAVIFFVNPVIGIGCYCCSAILLFQTIPWRRIIPAGIIAALCLALFVVPWTLRNKAALGTPVLLRSNGGLELALAMYPGAIRPADPVKTMETRLKAIHPFGNPAVLRRMHAAGGEVAYARALGTQAITWIRSAPIDAVTIAIRHVTEVYAPRPWQFTVSARGTGTSIKALCAMLVGVLGLAGVLLAVLQRRRHWIYPALMATVPVVLLAPFQPVPRYTYMFYALLAYCAAFLISSLVDLFVRARGGTDMPVA
ncbi:hypothetical protein [Sphingomonas mollis]|uniref:Glycosyltransferase RgtA/B/C/D-like domain-containing protein n=1 Tax=Sphingomonas mollis TaxID=2795726 RepID=A0ABS0XL62_9SPHN|nr:hypothetical protein [Sphingomonas sp. BT553]MBJ6120757.1 hypothetical protein [Sphingomonas sp. BT553]